MVVLRGEPDYNALPATTPATVTMVLHRCLQKDRKRRARDIGDVSLALEGASLDTSLPPPVAGGSGRRVGVGWIEGQRSVRPVAVVVSHEHVEDTLKMLLV